MKFKDAHNRGVIIGRPQKWDPDKNNFEDATVALWMLAQWANSEDIDIQRNGIVAIWDFNGITMKHVWATKHSAIINSAKWVQQGVVGRLKGYHLVNAPRIVGIIYSGVKPFLSKKIRKRLKFHKDLNSLHEYFDVEILPEFLGGLVSDDEYADLELLKRFSNSDDYFQGKYAQKLFV